MRSGAGMGFLSALMREQDSGTRSSVEKILVERGVSLSISMEMNSNGAIKQGVEVGLGLVP